MAQESILGGKAGQGVSQEVLAEATEEATGQVEL
jgi:hypothetical protein